MTYRCIAMPTEAARRFRATGHDDRGNALVRRVLTEPGAPCRHCLQPGQPGEAMLLGSYDLPGPTGIYWTPSPIFLHEADCPRFDGAGMAPTVDANSLVSVRAYDAGQLCLYDLGHVCQGDQAEAPLLHALADPRTSFVNIHTARPGCWLTRVERS